MAKNDIYYNMENMDELNELLEFIKDATLVGHHVDFDIEMINQGLARLGVGKLKNEFMDTEVMYQKLNYLYRLM